MHEARALSQLHTRARVHSHTHTHAHTYSRRSILGVLLATIHLTPRARTHTHPHTHRLRKLPPSTRSPTKRASRWLHAPILHHVKTYSLVRTLCTFKVVRVLLEDGSRMVGLELPQRSVDSVLDHLNTKASVCMHEKAREIKRLWAERCKGACKQTYTCMYMRKYTYTDTC